MRGQHQGATRRATASRIALGATLALAITLEFTLSGCTITPWRTPEGEEAGPAADTGVTTTAVPPPAVAASALPAKPAAESSPSGLYRVKPGDTLYRIAKASGQRPADLVSWNKLPADGKVQVGQLLRVAPPAAAAAATAAPATAPAKPIAAQAANSASKPATATAAAANASPAARSNARFIWPIEGSVAQPFKGKSKGVVIAGPPGQQVKAAASGRVVYAGSGMQAYGKLVIVKHDARLVTAYGRNARLLVKEGDTVKQGQAIAVSGTDGAGISALMFEVRENGKPVDPLAQLPKAPQ
ncbi:M23 family metallopeptidase [Paraburkholderia acidiphila]|uniref:Peptidoglycan DD-metalloendopeptidase family protein n=1 Tax=Paraburkholderia acidiphila TaxID=2571747 RepID=A0A7Z2GAA2_9BURK|nr:M23 family metallopeptidase [Paraburkholderia acidiphila]QGZ57884.1 peptidoglycan DD-metalloendopeptidase family protein [Paraburkholderia acidiphila]